MAIILENTALNHNTYKMTLKLNESERLGKCGQFYMLKPTNTSDPLLGRPISINDTDEDNVTVTFIYAVIGRGTELMRHMRVDDSMTINGPYGNTFPLTDDDVTLIGGSVGAAPLYLYAKTHRKMFPNRKISVCIGFRSKEDVILEYEFKKICDDVKVNIGGYVTDDVNFDDNRVFYACGPLPMMGACAKSALSRKKKIYLSMENHMACGVGACLVCTCKTHDGTKKRICKDGPVFEAGVVYDAEKGCFYE